MSAVATKPRAAKKSVAQPAWPELARIAASRLSELMNQASQADGGKSGSAFKALDDAESILIFMAQAPLTDSLWQPNDPWYALSLVEGIDALLKQARDAHEATGGLNPMQAMLLPRLLASVDAMGLALLEAPGDMSQLNDLQKFMDTALAAPACPKPNLDEPRPPTLREHEPMLAASGESEEDTPLESAWFRAAEAAEVMALLDNNSNALCGAMRLLDQAIEIVKALAPAGVDKGQLEEASCLMACAIEIIELDGQEKEDFAQKGALTLTRMSKEHLDGYWDGVQRHA